MIGFTCLAIVGFIMQISSDNPHVKYAGTFFAASGIYPNVPQGVAWNGNNIGGSVKRGVGIACHVGFGNLGGVSLTTVPYHVRLSLTLALDPGFIHLPLQVLSSFQAWSRHSHWDIDYELGASDLDDYLPQT